MFNYFKNRLPSFLILSVPVCLALTAWHSLRVCPQLLWKPVPRTGEDAERRRTGAAHPSSWCRGGFSAQPRPLPAACAPTLRAGVRPAASPRRRPALPGRGLRQAPPRHRRCYRRRSAARPQPWQRRGGGGAETGVPRGRGPPQRRGLLRAETRRDAPLPAGEGSASAAGGA